MSNNAVVNVVILAAVSLFAGVIGFVPEDKPQVVSGVGQPGASELFIEGPAGASGSGVGGSGSGSGVGGSGSGSGVGGSGSGSGVGGSGSGSGVGGSGSGSGVGSGANGSQGGQTGGPGGSGPAEGGTGVGECAPGRNGGSTDDGVTANRIGLASTHVTSGPGSTFLGQSQFGMQAVRVKVNSRGGICGRILDLKLVNDNWEAQRGLTELRNFLNDPNVFALPVVPSSEGLNVAAPEIQKKGMPVVGSDGMLISQYKNEWIWPVATATVSQMRIMAEYAKGKGANSFAIVYDRQYRFGAEGKTAYENYVKKMGKTFVHAEGIQPNQPGYGPQIDNLNRACGEDGCDAVAYLLDPGTANTWIQGDDKFTRRSDFRLGAQPLFTQRFGQDCGQKCDGMLVFTGYVPPLENNANLPGIREYVQDVKAVAPSADTTNQFLQGAYLGMSVFAEALRRTGPNLTRERLKATMNSMTYSSDLSASLQWSATQRKANQKAQAWRIKAGTGSFDGFSYTRSGSLQDPNPQAE
jgi:ABC-type branched-subunit amino acid transport system substrate-binding protein